MERFLPCLRLSVAQPGTRAELRRLWGGQARSPTRAPPTGAPGASGTAKNKEGSVREGPGTACRPERTSARTSPACRCSPPRTPCRWVHKQQRRRARRSSPTINLTLRDMDGGEKPLLIARRHRGTTKPATHHFLSSKFLGSALQAACSALLFCLQPQPSPFALLGGIGFCLK